MEQSQISWEWYVTRASALVGFLLLYVAIFAGTVSCLPVFRRIFLRLRSLNFHCWISFQALLFALVHAVSLLFSRVIPFGWKDVFIPFHANYKPMLAAFGTISFYLIIVLIVTSYSRRFFSYKTWRAVHFLNIALYILSIIHALYLGTDLKGGLLRQVFIWANGVLLFLLFYNLFYRIWLRVEKREVSCEINLDDQNENLRQSYPPSGEKRSYKNFRRRI